MKKYIITNNLSVLYDTREEAEAAFEAELAKLESSFAKSAFKFVYISRWIRIYDSKKKVYLN